MEEQYVLEKWEWSEADFERMGWHDCPVYALRFDDDIYLDIDYIFKWNNNGEGNSFTFWMAPATLVFEKPFYLKIDIETDFINGFEIAQVSKIKGQNDETIWNIMTQKGEIQIGAEKYRQIIRRSPSFQIGQAVPNSERGGISFSQTSDKGYLADFDVIKRKEEEFGLYKLALEKNSLIATMEQLDKKLMGTKQYLLKTREIKQRVNDIKQILRNTPLQEW